MSKNKIQSSLKNINFDELTAEQIIKKYEQVLHSRENQLFELSAEVGKVNQKLENLRTRHENCIVKNNELKTKLQKKETLLKQELDNKEIMFMQLTKKEKELDEVEQKIDEIKKKKNQKNEKDKNDEKNEKKEDKKKEENKIEKEKNEDKKKENNIEADPKSLAREKINQLTNKGEGMKKINFAELLKKNQEKNKANNNNNNNTNTEQ